MYHAVRLADRAIIGGIVRIGSLPKDLSGSRIDGVPESAVRRCLAIYQLRWNMEAVRDGHIDAFAVGRRTFDAAKYAGGDQPPRSSADYHLPDRRPTRTRSSGQRPPGPPAGSGQNRRDPSPGGQVGAVH
jgi:hypothetical protein